MICMIFEPMDLSWIFESIWLTLVRLQLQLNMDTYDILGDVLLIQSMPIRHAQHKPRTTPPSSRSHKHIKKFKKNKKNESMSLHSKLKPKLSLPLSDVSSKHPKSNFSVMKIQNPPEMAASKKSTPRPSPRTHFQVSTCYQTAQERNKMIIEKQIKRIKARLAKNKKTSNENTSAVSNEPKIDIIAIQKRKKISNKQARQRAAERIRQRYSKINHISNICDDFETQSSDEENQSIVRQAIQDAKKRLMMANEKKQQSLLEKQINMQQFISQRNKEIAEKQQKRENERLREQRYRKKIYVLNALYRKKFQIMMQANMSANENRTDQFGV